MDRRRYLATAAGLAGLTSIAGCASSGDDPSTTSSQSTDGPPTDSPTPTARATDSPTPTPPPTPSPTPTPAPTPTPGPGNYDGDAIREQASTVAYDEIFRNISDYEGEAVYFEYAQIYQTIYENDYTYLQINVSNNTDAWEGDVAATYWGEERLLEDDAIEMWAVVERLYEYETTNGDVRTIPMLTIADYELYEE